jgi:hypothetical protein
MFSLVFISISTTYIQIYYMLNFCYMFRPVGSRQVCAFTIGCAAHTPIHLANVTGGNLHVPQSHLAMRQKGVHCMGIQIYNSLPVYLTDLLHDKKQFITEIKMF